MSLIINTLLSRRGNGLSDSPGGEAVREQVPGEVPAGLREESSSWVYGNLVNPVRIMNGAMGMLTKMPETWAKEDIEGDKEMKIRPTAKSERYR